MAILFPLNYERLEQVGSRNIFFPLSVTLISSLTKSPFERNMHAQYPWQLPTMGSKWMTRRHEYCISPRQNDLRSLSGIDVRCRLWGLGTFGPHRVCLD